MFVLYVIDSLARGGAEQSLVSLAPELQNRGVRLAVAPLHRKLDLISPLQQAGIEVFAPDKRFGYKRLLEVKELAGRLRPDLIHTTLFQADITGRIAATLARRPVVSSLVNISYGRDQARSPTVPSWKLRAAQVMDATTARTVTRFHAISEHIADIMSRRLFISRKRIDVIPRGRDAEKIGRRTQARRMHNRDRLGLSDKSHALLAVARQEYQKGLDVLLEALPQVLVRAPETRLLLVGREGNLTQELHTRMQELQIMDHVNFLGIRDDVPNLMCAADVFVLPSRWEGFGSVILEAMATEIPIVATDLGPVREVVGEHSALLVPKENVDALAEAVVATLGDPRGSEARARKARSRFLEMFTIQAVAERTVGFYERALRASGG